MSAVIDAISDVLRPSSSQALNPPNPPQSSLQEEDKGNADVSTPQSHLKTEAVEPPTSTKVETVSSMEDRLATTRPDRGTTSAIGRRVSISPAQPLVATFTPEKDDRHHRAHKQYHAAEDDHSNPSDSQDEGSDLSHPSEALLSPYQPVQVDISIESNATSGTAALTGSSFSTPAELQLGPQSLPFILRRQAAEHELDASPSRLATTPFTPHPKHSNSSRITIRPDISEHLTSTPATRSAEDPVIEATVFPKLSSWRQEQLRNARPARLVPGTVPRPIPTLHGPLTLPYARNPSGVDATIADETAYMSHVFGLRPAANFGNNIATTRRSTSSGTQSSGTTGSRTTSGSSGAFNSSKTSQERSILTEGSSYTSSGGHHHSRPLAIRNPNQNIGIKAKGPVSKEGLTITLWKDAQDAKSTPHNATTILNAAENTELSSDSQHDSNGANKENINPATGQLRRRASETSLLEPRLGDSVIGPSKSFVDLRGITSLSPIPGSPADASSKDAFYTLFDHGLSAPAHPIIMGPPAGLNIQHPPQDAHTIRVPTYIPVYFNPVTMAYEVALPTQAGQAFNGNQIIHAQHDPNVVPGSDVPHNTPTQPSKADVSVNWRTRSGPKAVPQGPAEAARIDSQTDMGPRQSEVAEVNADSSAIMTIDNLFEKFNHPVTPVVGNGSSSVAFNPPSLSNPAVNAVLKPSRSHPASPRRSHVNALGESVKALNAHAPPYTPGKTPGTLVALKKGTSGTPADKITTPAGRRGSTSAKGTPGAGKLLKSVSAAGEVETEAAPSAPPKSSSVKKADVKIRIKSGKK